MPPCKQCAREAILRKDDLCIDCETKDMRSCMVCGARMADYGCTKCDLHKKRCKDCGGYLGRPKWDSRCYICTQNKLKKLLGICSLCKDVAPLWKGICVKCSISARPCTMCGKTFKHHRGVLCFDCDIAQNGEPCKNCSNTCLPDRFGLCRTCHLASLNQPCPICRHPSILYGRAACDTCLRREKATASTDEA